MKTDDYEYISMIMDGEGDKVEIDQSLNKLFDDERCQKVWYEYHLIRDCLKHPESRIGSDIHPSIKDKIQQEEVYHQSKIHFKPAANSSIKILATAAGIAAVAVAVWQNFPNQDTDNVNKTLISEQELPPAQVINVADKSEDSDFSVGHVGGNPYDSIDLDNPYLKAHQDAINRQGLYRVSGGN